MRWGRLGIVGAAVLLALHVVVLGGVDLGHPHVLVPPFPSTTSAPSGRPPWTDPHAGNP
jgi:hypothetical protein